MGKLELVSREFSFSLRGTGKCRARRGGLRAEHQINFRIGRLAMPGEGMDGLVKAPGILLGLDQGAGILRKDLWGNQVHVFTHDFGQKSEKFPQLGRVLDVPGPGLDSPEQLCRLPDLIRAGLGNPSFEDGNALPHRWGVEVVVKAP